MVRAVGRVRFYTTGDEVLGEFGRHEGVLLPHGYPYWFEAVGDEPLELLQVEASSRPMPTAEEIKADRVDHAPKTESFETGKLIDARIGIDASELLA